MKINCSHTDLVELHKLQPNPKNPNKHPERQIELLAKIIDYQGMRSPIVVSKRSGFITKGHGRLMALQKLGWPKAAVDYQDYDSEAQEYADVIADNKAATLAQHDDAMMIEELKLLDIDDFELLGMDDFELPIDPDEAKEEIEDDVPTNVDTRCKPGDLWILGEHRLYCADSTDILAVEKLMAGEKADMVFTDPPYGMHLNADWSGTSAGNHSAGSGGNRYQNIIGDHSDFKKEFISTVLGVFDYCNEIFLWEADYYAEFLTKKNDGSWVVWDKASSSQGVGTMDMLIGSNFELCWSKQKHKRDLARIAHKGLGSVESGKRVHPSQKPVQLAEWFFDKWGKDKNKIVDLFGGSGSTLIACEKTNRKCYMSELDPHYVSVIIERWKKYTDKEAYLIEDQSGPMKERVPYAEISSFRGEIQ